MIRNKQILVNAIEYLKAKCGVIAEEYTIYNNAYLFVAYPPNSTKEYKQNCLSTLYLVDIKKRSAGPFSPAFDIEGFSKVSKNFKKI